MQAFDRLARVMGGEPRVSNPPLIVPIEELLPDDEAGPQTELPRAYRKTLQTDRRQLLEQIRSVQLDRKVVGVGSVGTRA